MASLSWERLPADCVSTILSLTTPSDAGRASVVSSTFRSAADSDVVWETFLPENYTDILPASDDISDDFKFCSKRELFLRFCSPLLIDGGKKSFELDRFSGKISYILSARELAITWSSDPLCWSWKHVSQSKFSEVAELRTVSWLEIQGKIRTQILSPNTLYGAYILIKISERAYGLNLMPTQVSVEVGNRVSNGVVYLHKKDSKKQQMECLFYGNRRETVRKLAAEREKERVVTEREDGWMEIELGEFFSGEGDEEVKMSLMEIKGYQLKAGVIVEGIEVRPKH